MTLTSQCRFMSIALTAAFSLLAYGCSSPSETPSTSPSGSGGTLTISLLPEVQKSSDLFTKQTVFDPWQLTSNDPTRPIDSYLPVNGVGSIYGSDGKLKSTFIDGQYKGGMIVHTDQPQSAPVQPGSNYSQVLNIHYGTLTTQTSAGKTVVTSKVGSQTWTQFWDKSMVNIVGDPEANQITHANMFYLAGSTSKIDSIPPMGMSSTLYAGHIFWDAEIWMMPALIVQHPDLARGIVDYRFKRLKIAESLAKSHGYKGAEFPWESADTGKEEAPAGFDKERHITADIAFAAWQYYLWTGDKQYLKTEGWPIIKDSADYWISRAAKDSDGKYHIKNVIGPDETAGLIDDDAYTNAIVTTTLNQAAIAAKRVGESPNPKWADVANGLVQPMDSTGSYYIEYPKADGRLKAKQADTQMLIYPLYNGMDTSVAEKTLDFAVAHTEIHGPAMTDSINAIDAAYLGRPQQSLELFKNSYEPFERGPWDAFSEKRSTNGVYFCTGMGGCLQTVFYGFGGLHIVPMGQAIVGNIVASGDDASLVVVPHLPPGWTELVMTGVHFNGHVYNIDEQTGNTVKVTKVN